MIITKALLREKTGKLPESFSIDMLIEALFFYV